MQLNVLGLFTHKYLGPFIPPVI